MRKWKVRRLILKARKLNFHFDGINPYPTLHGSNMLYYMLREGKIDKGLYKQILEVAENRDLKFKIRKK